MKKSLLSILFLIPLSSFAQKGIQGVGVNAGGNLSSGESDSYAQVSLMFQHHLTNYLQIVPYFRHVNIDIVGNHDMNVKINSIGSDLHFFILNLISGRTTRLAPYVVGGISYGSYYGTHWFDYEEGFDERSGYTFNAKVGLGTNYRITYHLMLQVELNVEYYSEPYSRWFIAPVLGLAYTF